MDAQNDITAWISSIPKVTKYWFFSFFALPLTTRLGIISPFHLILSSELVFSHFQVILYIRMVMLAWTIDYYSVYGGGMGLIRSLELLLHVICSFMSMTFMSLCSFMSMISYHIFLLPHLLVVFLCRAVLLLAQG